MLYIGLLLTILVDYHSVGRDSLDVVELLHGHLDAALGGLDVVSEDEGVLVLDHLHARLGGNGPLGFRRGSNTTVSAGVAAVQDGRLKTFGNLDLARAIPL